MAAKKLITTKIETLTKLEYEQFTEVLSQFEKVYPEMRERKEFLGISVSIDAGVLALKITVTQLGESKFTEEMNLPKEFEATFPSARALLKITIKSAPILTSAAPKSVAGKKTAPIFPVTGKSQ